MNKLIIILITLLLSSTLFSALPPKVQKQKDLRMMESNLQLQDDSSVVLSALVVKKKEILPTTDKPLHKSFYKEVVLSIKVVKIIRNKNSININDEMIFRYSVFVANRMPGPKVYSIKVPQENETYMFYLNDKLHFWAKNYSIDTIDSELRNEALRNKKYFRGDSLDNDVFEKSKSILYAKNFIFKDKLTLKIKDEIKEFLNLHKEFKNNKLQIVGHTSKEGSSTYNIELSLHQAKKVKRFLVRELDYKKEQLRVIGYGKENPLCRDTNKHQFSASCSEINSRVTIHIMR